MMVDKNLCLSKVDPLTIHTHYLAWNPNISRFKFMEK